MRSRRRTPLLLVIGLLVAGGGTIALRARRADPESVYEQALTALESNRVDDAEQGMRELARLREPTTLDWGVRARIAIARGRTDEALDALAQIPDTHPLAGWARLRAGQLDLRRSRLRPAEQQLRAALTLAPSQVEARRELIYLLGVQLRRRELDEQFQQLARLSTLNPKEIWVWCMVRDMAWWEPAEHAALLRKALAADPEDRYSRLALAENLRRTGRYEEAQAALAALPARDPEALAARAGLALEREDVEACRSLLDAGPADHPALAHLRGRLALQGGDSSRAVRQLEIALSHEPGRRGTTADLGRALLLAGQSEKGRALIDAAARIDALDNLLLKSENQLKNPESSFLHTLGSACETAGRLPEARAWFALAVSQDPLDSRAQQALARLTSPPGPTPAPPPAK